MKLSSASEGVLEDAKSDSPEVPYLLGGVGKHFCLPRTDMHVVMMLQFTDD
jgi:hypothetical protein